jgi:hypothetical protein
MVDWRQKSTYLNLGGNIETSGQSLFTVTLMQNQVLKTRLHGSTACLDVSEKTKAFHTC